MNRDNLKAGIFVLSGIILILLGIFILADFRSLIEKDQTVQVYYTLSDGLRGLKPGAAVTLGDQPVGSVSAITDKMEDSDAGPRIVGKVVSLSVPERITIYQDAVIELKVPPLGSGTKLNIKSVGISQPYDGTPIPGGLAGNLLTKNLMHDAGIRDEQRRQIAEIIANVRDLTRNAKQELPEITGRLKDRLDEVEPVVEKAGLALDDARTAIADAREAVQNVKTVTADVKQRSQVWFDRLDSITASTDDTMTDVRQLVKDKGPDIRKAIENVRDVTVKVKEDTIPRLHAAMDKAGDAMDRAKVALTNVKEITTEVKGLITSRRPMIERILANLSLTASQLKLTSIEVRRSPWRLLYTPKDDELETDNLYDAARSFAVAAEALEATSETLSVMVDRTPEDSENITRMMTYLEQLFGRFKEAESEFWEALETTPIQSKGEPTAKK